jgi:uncharacterized protein (TIGR00255 family)
MVESMTGFGRGAASAAGTEVTVEVRSVNGRYSEVSVRAPRELGPHEVELQNRVRSALVRGKINVTVQAERPGADAPVQVDEKAARAYADVLDRLRLVAGISQPLQLEHLLQVKELLIPVEATADAGELWRLTVEALDRALGECQSMRRHEGAALAQDLAAHGRAIERELASIEETAPSRVSAAREALRLRVGELLDEIRVDSDRLELEIAILADRLDVNEECVRLHSHLDQFYQAIEGPDHSGRRLNFLSQELNREINTISSKANDAAIAHRAVTMKEELEKIREQVQNVV